MSEHGPSWVLILIIAAVMMITGCSSSEAFQTKGGKCVMRDRERVLGVKLVDEESVYDSKPCVKEAAHGQ